MAPAEVRKPGNQPLRVKARSLVCYWAVRELGMSGTSVSKLLGIGQPAVSRAVVWWGKIGSGYEFKLIKAEMHFFMSVPLCSKEKNWGSSLRLTFISSVIFEPCRVR